MNGFGNYDKQPVIETGAAAGDCKVGWDAIWGRLRSSGARPVAPPGASLIVVECYPGVLESEIENELTQRAGDITVYRSANALKPAAEIDALLAPYLGDDPVFGRMNDVGIEDFFDPVLLSLMQYRIRQTSGLVLVIGTGATLLADTGILVYADLPRWEIQKRQRANQIPNFGASNASERASLKYKRAYFVDWRAADRLKKKVFPLADFVLDSTDRRAPKLASGALVRQALIAASRRPFRVVPFFDPGPWGGQWLRTVCDLPDGVPNYAWGFDCVPEENSLLFDFGGVRMELPAIDLVFFQPRELLGDAVYARFGAEFPIRFDFLDTMGGGNLSLQVHPLTAYIREHFGLAYTQDESYYILDAGAKAGVYLGLRESIDARAMFDALQSAQNGGPPFPAGDFVNLWPAKKHDHFLIPAGTVHCSGKDAMVLEISATPYIFTFKLWDWERQGLDGRPRPIHLDHGRKNIQWNRTAEWVRCNLIGRTETVARGDGWREERTGLHESEFIETRRHWFTARVTHDTSGGVNVLNLVEGREVVVESPEEAFAPMLVHYAETFIVPAAVGRYTVRPLGSGRCATIKASVRHLDAF